MILRKVRLERVFFVSNDFKDSLVNVEIFICEIEEKNGCLERDNTFSILVGNKIQGTYSVEKVLLLIKDGSKDIFQRHYNSLKVAVDDVFMYGIILGVVIVLHSRANLLKVVEIHNGGIIYRIVRQDMLKDIIFVSKGRLRFILQQHKGYIS